MTRNLCAPPAQLFNPTISKFCHSSCMVITLHNSKILLSLHCFLTRQFQTSTNLLIGIFEVSNPTNFFFFFFFFEIGRNHVSIRVTIISNITVLQCYLLWKFVSIRRLFQFIVCIGVSTPPQKHQPVLSCQAPSYICKLSKPPFLGNLLPTYWFFMHPPKNWIFP